MRSNGENNENRSKRRARKTITKIGIRKKKNRKGGWWCNREGIELLGKSQKKT